MSTPADIELVLSLAIEPGTSGYKMHNAGYKALGLNRLYLPRRYEGDIAPAFNSIRALGIAGVSLTMPFKMSCIPNLDEISPAAAEIGAVNTVINNSGKLIGYNTDAPAAKKLIQSYLPWKEKPWVILGAGGMAHAFAYLAKELKVHAYICARNQEKARQLAQRFQLEVLEWDNSDAMNGKIIYNATPIGMAAHHSSESFYFQGMIGSLGGVFDAVASLAGTELIKAAHASSLPVVSGDMLALEQACLQFELYTGTTAPHDVMRDALYA